MAKGSMDRTGAPVPRSLESKARVQVEPIYLPSAMSGRAPWELLCIQARPFRTGMGKKAMLSSCCVPDT